MDTTLERIPGHLPRLVAPLAYDVVLEVDPREPGFSGEVTLRVEVALDTDRVHLHARGPRITRAEARLPDGTVHPATVAPATGPLAEPDYGEIVLAFPAPLPRGVCELYLAFEAPFDAQLAGLYRVKDDGTWYAFTQFEAADARKCFPCFDEPGFKVPFEVTLMVPEGMEALANTPEAGRDTHDGFTTVRFEGTRPLPTYLVAFAVGPFDVVRCQEETRVPIRAITPKGKGRLVGTALSFIPGILGTLEDWFGLPYPYAKLDVVAVPEFGAGAMENAGLITFREELLLADAKTLTRARERSIAEVMAHEIAHHWFGNLVTMWWWEDLWLNEAFATWMAAKACDLWRPKFDQRMELLQIRTRTMATDSLPAARKVRQEVSTVGEAEQAFDDLTYYKGAAFLTMIERWIGEDAFQAGVRAYLKAHEWGNATAADLFAHLDQESGQDVSGVAHAFLDQPGVPLVSVQPADGKATLTQSPFGLMGLEPPSAEGARWKIPVRAGSGDAPWRLLEDAPVTVDVGEGPLHPNLGEWSYYRWDLPEDALGALAAAGDALDVRSRLGLLDNAWAMVAAGRRSPEGYLRVLLESREATARPLVEELVGGIARVADVWEEVRGTAGLSALAGAVLAGHLKRIGFDPTDGEDEDDTIVRPGLVRALGEHAADPEIRALAFARAAAELEAPGTVPSELAAACLAVAARAGEASFDTLKTHLARATDPEQRLAALRALGLLPAGEPLDAALALTLTDAVRAQDFYYVFRAGLGRPETRDQTFAWFQQHFDTVRSRQPEFTFVHIGTIVGAFRTAEGRDAARAFLEGKAVPGGDRAIRQGVERANHVIALREAGHDAVAAFLENLAAGG